MWNYHHQQHQIAKQVYATKHLTLTLIIKLDHFMIRTNVDLFTETHSTSLVLFGMQLIVVPTSVKVFYYQI